MIPASYSGCKNVSKSEVQARPHPPCVTSLCARWLHQWHTACPCQHPQSPGAAAAAVAGAVLAAHNTQDWGRLRTTVTALNPDTTHLLHLLHSATGKSQRWCAYKVFAPWCSSYVNSVSNVSRSKNKRRQERPLRSRHDNRRCTSAANTQLLPLAWTCHDAARYGLCMPSQLSVLSAV